MTDDQDKPEAGKATYWLDLISHAEAEMQPWQDASDKLDRTYANLSELRTLSKEPAFQLFWSNIQVMGPSIYARPPVPVT